MREKEALTDPQTQVKESIGSGPFVFAKDQWVPGSKAVYLKNKDYVPRSRGAVVLRRAQDPGVDRIELVWISDRRPRCRRCQRRDRLLREPEHRLPADPREGQGREADEDRQDRQHAGHDPAQSPASAVRQHQGAAGDVLPDQPGGLPARHRRRPEVLPVCHGLLTCGGPYENDGGTQFFKEYNPKKALQLLKEAGYKGEPITVLARPDHNTITPRPRC
jgi:peptide/nickel transport system substrate-binding protein